VIFNIWKYGSNVEVEQLRQFLHTLTNLPDASKKTPQDQGIKTEIKTLILYHLQTFQTHLLTRPKPSPLASYTQLFPHPSPVWISHLTFTVEFLLDCSSELPSSKADLIPLGTVN